MSLLLAKVYDGDIINKEVMNITPTTVDIAVIG